MSQAFYSEKLPDTGEEGRILFRGGQFAYQPGTGFVVARLQPLETLQADQFGNLITSSKQAGPSDRSECLINCTCFGSPA